MNIPNENWRKLIFPLWCFGAAAIFGCASEPPSPDVDVKTSGVETRGAIATATPPASRLDTLARQALYQRKVRELQPTIAHLPADRQEDQRAALKRSVMGQ